MDNRKLTPLALAIEEINKHCESYVLHQKDVISILESLKPKEREMLESFASDYYISPIVGPSNLFNECLTQE